MTYNGSTFAILEILVRLASFNPMIGTYICHHISAGDVTITTTTGTIIIPLDLLTSQERNPELLDETTLRLLAHSL